MELRQLRTFRAVGRSLSFTRAAAELGYVQSSITAQVQALERELGVPLFDRLGRRVVLTDAGRRLLEYASRLVELEEEARARVSGSDEPSGSLTISASETHCTYRLPVVLSRYRARYPMVRPILRPNTGGALDADLRRALAEGTVDIAFVLEEPIGPVEHLVVEPLAPEPALVVAPPNHPLADKPEVEAADLQGESILLTEEGCAYRKLFQQALATAAVSGATILEFSSVEAIKQCAIAGTGVAVLSAISVADELAEGKLVELAWRGPSFGVVTQMVRHRGKWLSPTLSSFLELSRELCWVQPILRGRA